MAGEAVPAGDALELEAAVLGLVAEGQLGADRLDLLDRPVQELRELAGGHGTLGDHDHRLDRPGVFVGHGQPS